MRILSRWVIALLCAALAAAHVAAQSALPPVQQQGGISFITGGIGLDEASAFRAAAAQYNLRLTFAAASGAYLADAKVVLRDAQGRAVLEATSDGPYLFLKVPAGRYTVSADKGGETVTQQVQVRDKQSSELIFRWKVAAD